MGKQASRNHKIDNGKALLIFLVVFGHFLELFHGDLKSFLYITIYSFHMPAFAFFSGYFAKWNPGRLVKQILYPYLCFQILYLLFAKYCLGDTFPHPFTRPYWLMWYLVSMAFWYLLLPLINRYLQYKLYLLAGAALLALLSGGIPWVGYQLGISRTIVLFPFFLMGYLCRNVWKERLLSFKGKVPFISILLFLMMAGSTWLLWIYRSEIQPEWLYHSVSYAMGQYSFWIRGLFLLNAGVWTLGLLSFLPSRKIPFVSALGTHTIAVYLLHGFFVKAAKVNDLFYGNEYEIVLYALLLSLFLCFLLGNSRTERLFQFLFSAKWLER
jgi:fucose 4-O-acetylase-like acetyltransferase